MSACQRYSEYCQTLASRRELLEEEYAKVQRQLKYFQNAKEAYEVVGADISISSCIQPIELLSQKLEETKKALDELDPLPLAQEAMEELVERRNQLQDEFDAKWKKAVEAREVFIKTLEGLGELRRKSINLSHESRGIAQTLRQNPLEEIYIGSNRFDFDIDTNKLL